MDTQIVDWLNYSKSATDITDNNCWLNTEKLSFDVNLYRQREGHLRTKLFFVNEVHLNEFTGNTIPFSLTVEPVLTNVIFVS